MMHRSTLLTLFGIVAVLVALLAIRGGGQDPAETDG